MEGQVVAPHPKGLEAANLEGLETAEVLEATASLEVEANLEVLESVGLEAAVGSNLEDLKAERIVLPEASTERVWSWELQVDGGQEPFSPTGTDGRGDGGGSSGGARLEVRGGRLEVLAVRSVAVVWRRSLQVEGRPGAVQPNGCRTRPAWRQRPAWRRWWPGGPGGVQPGRGGMEGQVAAPHPGLEAADLEGLETAKVLEATAGLEVETNLEVLESVGLEDLEAVVETNLEGLEHELEFSIQAHAS
ncbi:unnamed protein product [Boreogadus saida]